MWNYEFVKKKKKATTTGERRMKSVIKRHLGERKTRASSQQKVRWLMRSWRFYENNRGAILSFSLVRSLCFGPCSFYFILFFFHYKYSLSLPSLAVRRLWPLNFDDASHFDALLYHFFLALCRFSALALFSRLCPDWLFSHIFIY